MSTIQIHLDRSVKPIKAMHAGGQPPLLGAKTTHFHYMTEAGIPFSRLHDVGGAYGAGRFVDIPNVFRHFDADENDPASYDFTFTDHLITALVEAGVEPYYRLGITIENYAYIKSYFTDPPKDFAKWARICEHVIAHYTEGWANGFRYKIRYWEIWNEPDNYRPESVPVSEMWSGTKEQFYELYTVTAKHLKARFPHLKIGGYGSCGFWELTESPERRAKHPSYKYFMDFFYGFFDYIKTHGAPIDFFSWHSYSNTKNTLIQADFLEKELARLGYAGLENHLNEWNPYAPEFGTAHHSAEVAAMMIGMQDKCPSILCIYDMKFGGASIYAPLFDFRTQKPLCSYYSMVAFNHLYRLGTQVELKCDTEGLYALAATNGKKHALLISNLTGSKQPLALEGVDLSDARFYVIDEGHLLSWAPNANEIENNAVILIEF
ncbi:MAG: hypothetical protein IKC59_08405 [Clostridia bacterium]|nr:hypothetical protein [Clostridia bacterium]MBR7099422.1 hypothetical protein [Clostridia bacterium]